MTNEVQVFNGLKIKEVNGQVMFEAESAATGLGLTKISKGQQYVRWERVNEYLGLSTSGQLVKRGDFITEPQFYKLAIKANNDTAERFQDWVTTEVLPSIRKNGSYQAKPMTEMEIVAATANKLVQQEKQLTQIVERQNTTEMQVAELKNEFGLPAKVAGKLKKLGASRVYFWLGGKDTNAYREVSAKVFSEMWRDFKNYFGELDSYTSLPMDQLQAGRDYIRNWRPSTNTVMDIERLNAQMELEV